MSERARRVVGWAVFAATLLAWGAVLSTLGGTPASALAEPSEPQPEPPPTMLLLSAALALAAAHAFVTRDPARAQRLNGALGALGVAAFSLVLGSIAPLGCAGALIFLVAAGTAGVLGLMYVVTSRRWAALLLPLSTGLGALVLLAMSLANFSPG